MKKKTSFTEVAVEKLLFDPSNPRFGGTPAKLSLQQVIDAQDAIQEKLEGEPHYALRLLESFKKNGFIKYEPLVVRQVRNKYIVIEGNRRLAAVRHILANPDRFPSIAENFKNIPVLIFHQAEDQSHLRDMRVYLGVRHLFGFKDWPAESKAKFLDEQIKVPGDLEKTVDELGITKHTVRRYLVPFRMTRKARKHLKGISDQEFWVLGEALTRSGIPEYLDLVVNPDTFEVDSYEVGKLKSLIGFLYGTLKSDGTRDSSTRKVTDTRDSSKLAKVLGDSKASAKFEKGATLEEAFLEVQTPSQNVLRLKQQLRELAVVIRNMNLAKSPEGKQLKITYRKFVKAARLFLKNA